MASTQEFFGDPTPPPLPRSASQPKPKGILKNAPPTPGSGGQHLQWDEQNIALTEIQKDSLMKITEPKTPYVRYNAETDEIEGDIPNLDLYGRNASSSYPTSPTQLPLSELPSEDERTSRRASASPGPSKSNSGGSRSSSRSTSFSLPKEFSGKEMREAGESKDSGEVEEEEMDEETAAKHEAFLRARGRHYSNEAEAMKKAQKLIDEEEEETEGDGSMEDEEDSGRRARNGIVTL